MNKNKNTLFFKYTYKFLHEYLVRDLNRSEKTEISYTDALTLFRRYSKSEYGLDIDKLQFFHITKDFVLGFRIWLLEKQKNKPQTVNQRIAALNSYLQFAAGEDISLSSIRISIGTIPSLRTQKPNVEGISVEALKAIFEAIPNTRLGRRNLSFLVLLYDSGARISEILGLKTIDLQLDGKYPHVHLFGKGKKTREVPLGQSTVKLLKNYIKEIQRSTENGSDYLFQINRKGICGPLSYDCVDKFLKIYGKIAEKSCSDVPKKLSLHKFRHAKALHMVENNIPLPIIAEFLGHENISTTMIYGKPTMEMIRDALSKSQEIEQKVAKKDYSEYEKRRLQLCGIRK
jgi:site-specific recombinase XerD